MEEKVKYNPLTKEKDVSSILKTLTGEKTGEKERTIAIALRLKESKLNYLEELLHNINKERRKNQKSKIALSVLLRIGLEIVLEAIQQNREIFLQLDTEEEMKNQVKEHLQYIKQS
ncbi:MAG: hypothetical protein QXV73_04370 [Candidatus Micrarchaeia archaeon]